MKKYSDKQIKEFLIESNAIEGVFGTEALNDSLEAWKYLSKQKVLTPGVILETHLYVMRNLRGDIAGFWRNCDVWIGGQLKRFISTHLIENQINTFCLTVLLTKDWEGFKLEDLEKLTKDAHVSFEDIHIFEDGNGRVGRLIYLWHRAQLGLPIHIIHADWPKDDGEQKEYYSWFKKIKNNEDINLNPSP